MKWARLLLVLVLGAGVASALEAKGVAQSMLPNAPRCQTDASLAAEYMQKAVASGDSEAYSYMAEMYHYGEGVPSDMQKAETWYRKAIIIRCRWGR